MFEYVYQLPKEATKKNQYANDPSSTFPSEKPMNLLLPGLDHCRILTKVPLEWNDFFQVSWVGSYSAPLVEIAGP